MTKTGLIDKFGRTVNYVRISVTDRCDFRCVYCMAEDMSFVPRSEVLSFEEIILISRAFVELGVSKIRLTGGEPMVRAGVMELCHELGALEGLDELVMTTNGASLKGRAAELKRAGVSRINISLDSLQTDRFKQLTRTGDLNKVLEGIAAAKAAGFEQIKLNAVILKGRNDDEVMDLVEFALGQGLDISFIEEMPLGAIEEHSRQEAFMSSDEILERLTERWTLAPQTEGSHHDGPSRYYAVEGSNNRVGLISPHSHNFCSQCNRVRVTAEGRLLLCLGNEHSVDLRALVRRYPNDLQKLKQTLIESMDLKPERHYFDHSNEPDIVRFMNATGG